MIALGFKERSEVLTNVQKLVAKKLFAPNFDIGVWNALVCSRRDQILQAETIIAFENQVRKLLDELKTSHLAFFHQNLFKIPPQFSISATFQRHDRNGSSYWMFQDVHEGGPAHQSGFRPGDLLLAVNGEPVSPPERPAFHMGGFCDVEVEKLSGGRTLLPLGVPQPTSQWHPIIRPRLISWSRLQSRTGLLRATGFPGQVGIDVAHEIDHAMLQLSQCDRLIVDLRGNPGGGAGALRLMSYLTPDKRPVGYSLTRRRAAKGYRREKLPRFGKIPSGKLALFVLMFRYAWADKSIVMVTEGLGPQTFHGQVVLLVNEHSASASENVIGFAKENHLATIVGTRTAGQVLGGTGFKVGHGFVLRIPVVGYLTWNGSTLEGAGVEPDHPVALSRDALKEGRDSQMEKAIEVVQNL